MTSLSSLWPSSMMDSQTVGTMAKELLKSWQTKEVDFLLKLTFGLRNNEVVHISEVEKGLACDCYCPSCNNRLIAKKGNLVSHHFAHYKSEECSLGSETAIHLAAKEILASEMKLYLPDYPFDGGRYTFDENWNLFSAQVFEFDSVDLERRVQNVVPDVILYKDGRPLFIEIAVTHYVDWHKLDMIKNMGASAIEISISPEIGELSWEKLRCLLLGESNDSRISRYWLYNEKLERLRRFLIDNVFESISFRGLPSSLGCPKKYNSKPKRFIENDPFVFEELMQTSRVFRAGYQSRYVGEPEFEIGESFCDNCLYNVEYYQKEKIALCSGKHEIASFLEYKKLSQKM